MKTRASLRSLAGLTTSTLLLAGPLGAQTDNPNCDGSSYRALADSLAPVIRFAPGERYFPTIPFFSAVDGVDNNRTGGVDVADPDEIAPLTSGGNPSIRELIRYYDHALEKDKLVHAVFYRVCMLDMKQTDHIWGILARDPQAHLRLRIADKRHRFADSRFMVFEYFMYYINDIGLTGHAQDIETVFVFIPEHCGVRCSFRIVVGAAHSDVTPNNVLIRTDPPVGSEDTRTLVLVELGGHASAPDADPPGVFILGQDVNWYPLEAYGVRDLPAVAGARYYGDFHTEYAFARTENTLVFRPPSVPCNDAAKIYEQPLCKDQSAGMNARKYRLYAVSDFRNLDLELSREHPDTAVIFQWWGHVFPLVPLPSEATERARFAERLRMWTQRSDPYGRHKIWDHPLFRNDPTVIFKEYLFPPSHTDLASFVSNRLTWGIGVVPGDASELYGGLVTRAGVAKLHIGGTFEFQGGIYASYSSRTPLRGLVSVLYQRHYSRMTSYYVRLAYRNERSVVFREGALADWTMSGGIALQLRIKPKNTFLNRITNAINARIGIQMDVRRFQIRPNTARWEFQFGLRQ